MVFLWRDPNPDPRLIKSHLPAFLSCLLLFGVVNELASSFYSFHHCRIQVNCRKQNISLVNRIMSENGFMPSSLGTGTGKKLFAIGFGSNYFHPFTDEAVPLYSESLKSRHAQTNVMFKENADVDKHGPDHRLCDIPSAFIFPLQLKEETINADGAILRNTDDASRITEERKEVEEKLSASQRIRKFIKWRRKSRKREEQKEHELNILNSNSSQHRVDFQQNDLIINPITSMSAGLTHNALIAHGELYLMGTLHGKLYLRPTIQQPRTPLKCTQISCGRRHVLALFENRVTMSCGSGYFGQLGHGMDRVYCEELTVIEHLNPRFLSGSVVSVEAGGMNSAAIVTKEITSWQNRNKEKDIETKVFRWGSNRCGQCAIDEENCNTIPYPTPMIDVHHPETGKKVSFVSLALGNLHSVGLTQNGQVYSWGATSRCGHGSGSAARYKSALKGRSSGSAITLPKRIEALKNANIVQVSIGDAHTLALSKSGRVFSWGGNSYGQLGFGHTMHILSPKIVSDLQFSQGTREGFAKEALSKAAERISHHHSSDSATMENHPDDHNFIPRSFDLSATIGHIHYPSTPQKKAAKNCFVNSPPSSAPPSFINYIHASGSYSAAVSSSGDLYTWGCAESEQLGHPFSRSPTQNPNIEPGPLPQAVSGLRIRDSRSFDSRLNVLIPRRVECLRKFGLKVEMIAASPHFISLICSDTS